LSLGQAFLSNIHTDLVVDSEFENIRIGQTFLSNVHTDPVAENEFENIRIAQTYLSNIYSDPIITTPAGYSISGSHDYSGNYTTSGTLPPSSDSYPAWQHASNNYILVYTDSPSTGWALFPGTLADGYTGPPIAWQACGYPGGGGGTCAQEIVTGDYVPSYGEPVLFTVS
jgi:hypothetical protein